MASLLFCVSLCLLLAESGFSGELSSADWNVTYPKFCAGQAQSPVDIVDRETVHVPTLNLAPFRFNAAYREVPCEMLIVNSGKQLDIIIPDYERREISGGGLSGKYIFHSMHFHYGPNTTYGAEHLHNGKRYPSEVHLVHFSAKFRSLDEALQSDARDALAVFGSLIETSDDEETGYPDIFENIESAEELKRNRAVAITPFSPTQLLPMSDLDDYWRYYGSLTTPPCQELVAWTVFRTPLAAPKAMMEKMFNLMVNLALLAPDQNVLFRLTQPLNGRVVMRTRP